jgi:hypothetical protein
VVASYFFADVAGLSVIDSAERVYVGNDRYEYRNFQQTVHLWGGGNDDSSPFEQLLDRAKELRSRENRNDCLALVDLFFTAFGIFDDLVDAVNAISKILSGSTIPGHILTGIIGERERQQPLVNFGSSGFATGLTVDVADNQVSHFMGGFAAGWVLGTERGLATMNGREDSSVPADAADIRANGLSVPLGNSARNAANAQSRNSGAKPLHSMATDIRKNVCAS